MESLPVISNEPVTPRCHVPWQQMVIDSNGMVSSCAYRGAYGNVQPTMGNVNESSIAEVWNGEEYQKLRRYMAAGDLESAGCANCYAIKQNLALGFEHDPEAEEAEADRDASDRTPYVRHLERLREEIASGETVLESNPTVISFSPSHKCNIRCTHCYQEHTRTLDLKRQEIVDEFMELCPTMVQLIAGGGEPFVLPIWRRLLAEFDPSSNPYLEFATTTNGTIVTDATEEGLRKFKTLKLIVSLDGTGDVYEKVRVGGRWDPVYQNVRKLKRIAGEASDRSYCGVSMAVMKSNVLHLPEFIRYTVREELKWSLSPVMLYPPDESLASFNDPEAETAGWLDAYEEARRVTRDEYVPMYERLTGAPVDLDHWLVDYGLLADATPWELFSGEHHRVTVELPTDAVLHAMENHGSPSGLFVYLFPSDREWHGCALYYARLQSTEPDDGLVVLDDAGNVPVEDAGPFRFEASLREGEYTLNLSTKWHTPSRDPRLRFSVHVESGNARVETHFGEPSVETSPDTPSPRRPSLLRRVLGKVARVVLRRNGRRAA